MSSSSRNKSLFQACQVFRHAIEITPKENLSLRFSHFPRGSCGDASPLLGLFLDNSGFGSSNYICGEKNHELYFESHAWLEMDDLYIDITGDQFYCRPSVFCDLPDRFFLRYSINLIRYPHPYYESLTKDLLADYRAICTYLM